VYFTTKWSAAVCEHYDACFRQNVESVEIGVRHRCSWAMQSVDQRDIACVCQLKVLTNTFYRMLVMALWI